jgi:hypothetical protein
MLTQLRMKRMRPGVLTALLALTFAPPQARADESAAERLFREGRALMLEGRYSEACPKIAQSHELEPHVGTLLNLAACHEKTGKIATAWVQYQQALTAAQAEGQPERARLARERIDAIEPRVPWLTVSVPASASAHGLSIALDGAPIQSIAWGKEMPVDPGVHLLAATAQQRKPWEERFDLRESEHKSATVPSLEAVATTPPQPTAASSPSPAPAPTQERLSPSPWVFETGLFVGLLSVHSDRATPTVGADTIPLRSQDGRTTNCGVGCTYSLNNTDGAAVGVNLFAGYAASERARVGGRLLAGPRIDGGSVIVTGPELSLRIGRHVSSGLSVLLGNAAAQGYGTVTPSAGYNRSGDSITVDASTGLSGGFGLELGVRLFEVPGGALAVNTTPFFLPWGTHGGFWGLPFSVAYQFY